MSFVIGLLIGLAAGGLLGAVFMLVLASAMVGERT
jgi:hypothetical protein